MVKEYSGSSLEAMLNLVITGFLLLFLWTLFENIFCMIFEDKGRWALFVELFFLILPL